MTALCGCSDTASEGPVAKEEILVKNETEISVESVDKESFLEESDKEQEEISKPESKPEVKEEPKQKKAELSEENNQNEELTCFLSVRCDTILDNISRMDSKKLEIIPDDGIIFAEKAVAFNEGESVFNVLVREMKRNKIHMEFEMSPVYETAYIEGIANIYEFDCGELSGWLYKVNGQSPGVGCSLYKVNPGDRIEWIYNCG